MSSNEAMRVMKNYFMRVHYLISLIEKNNGISLKLQVSSYAYCFVQ